MVILHYNDKLILVFKLLTGKGHYSMFIVKMLIHIIMMVSYFVTEASVFIQMV